MSLVVATMAVVGNGGMVNAMTHDVGGGACHGCHHHIGGCVVVSVKVGGGVCVGVGCCST